MHTDLPTFLTGADLLLFCKYGEGPIFSFVEDVFFNFAPSRPRPPLPLADPVFSIFSSLRLANKVIASLANSIASSSRRDELYLKLPSRFLAESRAFQGSFSKGRKIH